MKTPKEHFVEYTTQLGIPAHMARLLFDFAYYSGRIDESKRESERDLKRVGFFRSLFGV